VNRSRPLDIEGQSLPGYPAFHCSEAGRRHAFGSCFIDTTPNTAALAPSTRPAAAASSLAQRATAFVIEDMNQSQGSTADFLNYARKALDDRIDYYGKSTIRAEVLKDKERYVKNWPVRSCRLLTDTIRASCNESQSSCQVSGLLEFNLSNPANGKTSAGTPSFEYGIRFGAEGGRIFSENGKLQSARK